MSLVSNTILAASGGQWSTDLNLTKDFVSVRSPLSFPEDEKAAYIKVLAIANENPKDIALIVKDNSDASKYAAIYDKNIAVRDGEHWIGLLKDLTEDIPDDFKPDTTGYSTINKDVARYVRLEEPKKTKSKGTEFHKKPDKSSVTFLVNKDNIEAIRQSAKINTNMQMAIYDNKNVDVNQVIELLRLLQGWLCQTGSDRNVMGEVNSYIDKYMQRILKKKIKMTPAVRQLNRLVFRLVAQSKQAIESNTSLTEDAKVNMIKNARKTKLIEIKKMNVENLIKTISENGLSVSNYKDLISKVKKTLEESKNNLTEDDKAIETSNEDDSIENKKETNKKTKSKKAREQKNADDTTPESDEIKLFGFLVAPRNLCNFSNDYAGVSPKVLLVIFWQLIAKSNVNYANALKAYWSEGYRGFLEAKKTQEGLSRKSKTNFYKALEGTYFSFTPSKVEEVITFNDEQGTFSLK